MKLTTNLAATLPISNPVRHAYMGPGMGGLITFEPGEPTPGGGTGDPATPPTPWKPTTQEEKDYCTALANRSYGEGANKAERALQADLDKANDQVKTLKADLAKAQSGQDKEGNKLYSEGEVQTLIEQAKAELKPKLDMAEQTAERYRLAQINVSLTKAIAENKGRDTDLIGMALRDQLTLDNDGNVFVKDEKGNPKLNSEGKKMSVSELVVEYLKPRAYLQEGSNLPGNDSHSNNNNQVPNSHTLKPGAPASDVASALANALASANVQK